MEKFYPVLSHPMSGFLKHFKKFSFVMGLSFALATVANAQTVEVTHETPGSPGSVTICGVGDVFTVRVKNTTEDTLTSVTIDIAMAKHVNYIAGSIVESTNKSVAESDISDLNDITLSCNNIPDGDSVMFTYKANAECGAIAFKGSGGVFQNTATANYSGGSANATTINFNLKYASLSILSVSPVSKTGQVGQTFTRDIQIINGGNGRISTAYLADVHNTGIDVIGTNIGTLSSGDTIFLSSTDFQSVGNGDGYLDQFESITVTETVEILSCDAGSSSFKTGWGCDGSYCQEGSNNATVVLDLDLPSLSYSPISPTPTCYDAATADARGLMIINSGDGPAVDLEVEIKNTYYGGLGYATTHFYTRLDTGSITYKTAANGSDQALTPTATSENTNYACFSSGNAMNAFTVEIPLLAAGDTIWLNWDAYTCCLPDNLSYADIRGWAYEVDYLDQCEATQYNDGPNTGYSYNRNQWGNVLAYAPTDMNDGDSATFTYTNSSVGFIPGASDRIFEFDLQVPSGLLADTSEMTFMSGTIEWVPDSVNFDTSFVKAYFRISNRPSGFSYTNSIFSIEMHADCDLPNAGDGTVASIFEVHYTPDPTNCASCEITMETETANTYLHCPGTCSEGIVFRDFDMARSNFGSPDNDNNGLADGSGSIDLDKVKEEIIMYGDTLESIFFGTVATSVSYPDWEYVYASTTYENDYYANVGAYVLIHDASTGNVYTCNSVSVTKSSTTFAYDLSVADLNTNGCGLPSGFKFEQDDSIYIYASVRLTTNIGGAVTTKNVTNAFYASDVTNPTSGANKFQCNNYAGIYVLCGYYHTTYGPSEFEPVTCSAFGVSQNYYLSIGPCCSNYAGGNMFPYEYRNWSHIANMSMDMPDGYRYSSASFSHTRTAGTAVGSTQSASVSPVNSAEDTLFFQLEGLFEDHGGSMYLSDDGYYGTLTVYFTPSCDVNENVEEDIFWSEEYAYNARLGLSNQTIENNTHDDVKYRPPIMSINPYLQTVQGLGPNAEWIVIVQNTAQSSAADNVWISASSTGDVLQITAVKDMSADTMLANNNDIYKVGAMAAGGKDTFIVMAAYTACQRDSIILHVGQSCEGYPASYSSQNCFTDDAKLYVNPQPAEMQASLSGPIGPVGACTDIETFSFDIQSVQLGAIDNLEIIIDLPSTNGLTFVPNSGMIYFPHDVETGSALADPISAGSDYVYKISDNHPYLDENGLEGVTNLDSNRLVIQFDMEFNDNWVDGHSVTFRVTGTHPCQSAIDTVDFGYMGIIYDPNSVFIQYTDTNSQLVHDELNTWNASWGDYNADGWTDIFIPNYDQNGASKFYRNDQDGTFTEITNQQIMMDTIPALASAWADFDNDGDLDLAVATNIGGYTHLYRNDNGTYTDITAGEMRDNRGYGHSLSWVDYDNDGNLDLFVSDYMPTRFNALYNNNGDGTFQSVENSLTQEANYSIGAAWGDYDNDGDMDVYVTNANFRKNNMYRNDGNGAFTPITSGEFVTYLGNSVAADWGDYDNDGDLDLFVAEASGTVSNKLFTNNGNGTFTTVTTGDIATDEGKSHGSSWIDFNNDEYLDMFVANDADQNNFLYKNNGDGTFTKQSNELTAIAGNTFGSAWADFDQDGDLDPFMATQGANEELFFYNHKGKCNNSVCLNLTGMNSNKSAIGAMVKVKVSSSWLTRQLDAQGGFSGQDASSVFFGIGSATQVDSVVIQWPSGYTQSLGAQDATYGECVEVSEPDGSEVCGVVYHDANADGDQDAGEIGLANVLITVTPAPYYAITDTNGNYSLRLPDGAYTITQTVPSNWTQSTPTSNGSQSVTVSGLGNTYCGNDFGNTASCVNPDLNVSFGTTAHRRGLKNTIVLTYSNTGTSTATNTEVTLNVGSKISLIEASTTWNSVDNNTYTWNVGDVKVGERASIYITDSVSATAEIGEQIDMTANISYNSGAEDCDGADNSYARSDTVVSSIDPNDKLALHASKGRDHEISNGQELTYKIRFQNMGNSAAELVEVRDPLSAHIDINSIELGAASHPFKFEIQEGNVLVWRFEGINLPDSLTNEPESHGFVQFKARLHEDLVPGTKILNHAEISFDNTEAVITNTVFNTIKGASVQTGASGRLNIWPNPTMNTATIQVNSADVNYTGPVVMQEIMVVDIAGRIVEHLTNVELERYTLDQDKLETGLYVVKVVDQFNKTHNGQLIVQ